MNYKTNLRYINFCFKTFCAVSILLFSFAPYLALESTLTQLISKFLYGLWFLTFVAICCFGEFSKRKLKKCLFLFLLILIFSVIGISSAGVAAFVSQFPNLIIPMIVAVLFYSISNLSLKKKDLSVLFCIFFACSFLNCIFAIYTVFSFNGDFNTLYISKASHLPPAKLGIDDYGFVCDSLVLVLLLLSGFINVVHLGFLTLLLIAYKFCEIRSKSQ